MAKSVSAISCKPFRGAGEAGSFSPARFTCEISGAAFGLQLPRPRSLDFQRGDRFHHALAESLIHLFAAGLQIGFGETNWVANDDGDRAEAEPAAAARHCFVRAEDSHG